MDNSFEEVLRSLLSPPTKSEDTAKTYSLDVEDRAFAEKILNSVTSGSQGVFAVVHPDGRMQYIIINGDVLDGIVLLSKIISQMSKRA
jgi:hypothetical protein